MVQKLGQGAGFDPHHCLFARDHPVFGQGHRDPQVRPAGPRHLDRIQHGQTAILDGEFDLHLFAQAGAADGAVINQSGEDVGRHFLQRRAARVACQIERLGRAQGVAALGLAEIAPGDLRLAGHRIDELDHA